MDLCEFQASLDCRVSCRTARAVWRDPALKGRKECERSFIRASQHALCLAPPYVQDVRTEIFKDLFFMHMCIYVCMLYICILCVNMHMSII